MMATKEINKEKARFDTRLTKEQKAFFERAAHLGGFRSLTDFVVLTVQKRAKEIILESEQFIASQQDSEVFFNAITNPGKPNQKLTEAANEYKAFSSK
ncbi:MAG: DUF1778 domain-containing protein [Bacteroides sp.]|nr:DUF1778 domain-containing protein [Bacteroides sp.]